MHADTRMKWWWTSQRSFEVGSFVRRDPETDIPEGNATIVDGTTMTFYLYVEIASSVADERANIDREAVIVLRG